MKNASRSAALRHALRELASAIEAIAEGERAHHLPLPEDDDDLQRVARAVNRITEALSGKEEALGENIRSLQSVNRALRDTQETLVRSEKLATIGRLAAGVAHEIGNPLGAIVGYLDIMKRTSGLDEEARGWLGRIDGEARRIDTIIRELLDFARPAGTALQAVDVNEVVESVLSLLSHQKMFARVRLERHLESRLPPATAENHRLRQVLVNLLMNSCDAMPDGGGIRVSTETATAPLPPDAVPMMPARRADDPPEIDFSHLRPRLAHDPTLDRPFESEGKWIRIQVTDEGRGIPPDQLREVFDPFFTTKPPGQGTGLGLAITLATIRAFRGRVQISSRVNVGTTVTLELPVAGLAPGGRFDA